MKITAAVTREAGADFTIEDIELEEPRDNEVLVRIVGAGVCHTDIAARDQELPTQLPAVLGHEGSGVVEKVGSNVTSVKPGDHVVLSYTFCEQCKPCDHDHINYCQSFAPLNFVGMRADGSSALSKNGERVAGHFFGQSSFASYALAYENNVVKVRDDAPLELLGPLGCGIQTGAGTMMRSFACEAGSAAAVVGGGAVGLSAVLGAVVQGCNPIIVIEPHANRRELALSLGATHVIDPLNGEDVTEKLREICPNGIDYVLDTTGLQSAITSVYNAMAAAGTIGLVGVPKPDKPNLEFGVLNMLLCGVNIKGICEGDAIPSEFIPVMVDLFMEGKFPFDKLCQTFDFKDINDAVAAQHKGSCIKAVLKV